MSSKSFTPPPQEDGSAARPNRVLMPGMIWSADHVLHLALKQETQTIPAKYFEQCEGILLLNMVEVGLLVSGSYGTGVLLAKDYNNKWSPPCAMGIKSLGIGSLGTAVRDLIVFLFDRKSLENLTSQSNLSMKNPGRVTLGPLRRHETYIPRVSSKDIDEYSAFSFTKGAFAGITVDYASLYPLNDANNSFYKKKGGVTPEDIIFDGSVQVPKNTKTLLPNVYQKLAMLSKGAKYDGNEKKQVAEQAPAVVPARQSVMRKASTSSTKSAQSGGEKHPSVTKKTLYGEKRPSVSKVPNSKPITTKPATRPVVSKKSGRVAKSSNVTQTSKSFSENPTNTAPVQKLRPSVTKNPSVKRSKPATANGGRRPSLQIKGYNC